MPLFPQDRAELRRTFVESWRKFRAGEPMEPLEQQVAAVIAEHPEYHTVIEAGEAVLQAEFLPEAGAVNPFLHLSLHLGLREQLATDRPAGIAALHTRLSQRLGSTHEAEHRMLEVLAEMIWETQRSGVMPDEQHYLDKLKRLV